MDKFTNNNDSSADGDIAAAATGEQDAQPEQLRDPTRRRFSRGALAGGAVVLSLGNRPAWGAVMGCMSVATLNSFNPTTQMFISAPGGRPEHNEDLAAEIHRLSDPPDFLGTDDTYSTCEDPNSLDRICLVKGKCP